MLKNTLIIAILAAVGYGVYVSLARNGVDPGQAPGVAEGWPVAPNVELPSSQASLPPGGLPTQTGAPTSPATVPGFGMGGAAPSFASAPAAAPVGNPLSTSPAMTPVTPYSSSTPAPISSTSTSSNPTATLGAPVAPDAVSAMLPSNLSAPPDPVRNFAPPPDATAANSQSSSAESPTDSLFQSKVDSFMEAVQRNLDKGKLAEAHAALSTLYGNADLPPDLAKQITTLLDQLAGTVIYSRQHYLEPAYVAQPGDTLESVAQKYNIPWQLLARINGLMPPGVPNTDNAAKDQPLSPGREMKVVRGPFDAVIRLDRHELTLMIQNRYAGRFPIGIGRDQPTLDGAYSVRDKTVNPNYYGPDGVTINANDPSNPLGGVWIGLSDRIGIHGANNPQAIGRDDNRGTICVSQRDAQDLYGILSVGSRVTIMR